MARFIDFYKRQNLIPTHQQGISQEILGRRRMALHSDLGLPINLLKGKSVIEFGPGGGYNASQILKYSPHSYHFVDAMHPEIAVLEENIQEGKKLGVQIEFFQSFFSDFTSDIHYDLVIAEACLPGQDDPLGVLERISTSVSENGFLIITNTCKTSLLSEILRSVIGKWISKHVVSESELTDKCIEALREVQEA